ncbi:DNA polymerase I [Desulfovibrio ferrophilus]|uniref:DNA polymerase I n=1 Tax=Desulfovibrio ferrophilus TaxID=241368 RepID=A0A2Z6B2K3_9BACT|nr:DNA polymerase I [Desulfovibrio ferrophilus]BBD09754.1 DNA polymerase I [Desulfovibrio ferrophilus]
MSLKQRLGLDQDPIFLVDGHAFLYRFFYAYQDMRRADGFPTNSLFLFLRMIFGLIRTEQPQYAGFFFDGRGKTFRHDLFESYKAQRPPMPEDLRPQIDPIQQAIRLMGFKVIVSDGNEADDCIASLAARFKNERPVVIVGADKDLKQCLDERVYLWDPGSKADKLTGLAEFREETGMEPDQWPDFQALIGDSADNIPGIPKVGPKTAQKIMADSPTLEDLKQTLIDGGGDFTKAMRKKLQDHIGDAFLYRKLTRLELNACSDTKLEDFSRGQADHDEMLAFLQEYEFRTLLRELPRVVPPTAKASQQGAQAAKPSPGTPDNDHVIAETTSKGEVPQKAPATSQEPSAKAQIKPNAEQTGQTQGTLFDMAPTVATLPEADVHQAANAAALPAMTNLHIGLIPDDGGFYLGIGGEEWHTSIPASELVPMLSTAASIATPDVKALLRENDCWWTIPEDRWFDLGLAAYLLSPEDRNYTWDRLTQRLAPELLDKLVAGQGLTAKALAEAMRDRLSNAGLADLMRDLETPLIPMLGRMEIAGVRIDRDALAGFLKEVTAELNALTEKIYEQAGRPFNMRSSQQLAEILFTDLGLKPRGKTPGGVPSTSFAVLEKIKHEHPIIEDIQAFRKLEKMRSTYLEPLPKAAGPDGRIHTTFNQLTTATGRLSSSGPNMQNIPIRSDMGLRMRACFIAEPDNLLVGADYSQIELRVLAHYSGETTLIEAFRHGQDIHSRTAALLFDTSPEEVSRDQRGNAKTINFGLIYGMGPQKLAAELGIKLAEAKEFIERYFERLSGLKEFYESVEASAREHGFVTTLAGRRRLLPDINSRNKNLQSQARRQAINTLIQGSAADIIKLAMLAADHDEELKRLEARLILQVHDELLLECPADRAEQAASRLEEIMSGVYELAVPLAVDKGIGKNWAEAH